MSSDPGTRSRTIATLTFAEIRAEIVAARDAATATRQSWTDLLGIVDALAAEADSSFAPVRSETWALTEVSIVGYQGVGNDQPLVLTFDPNPGVTVLHGPNGAGKSSISDAIEMALYRRPGGPNAPRSGTGGKQPLWERVHPGRDAAHSEVRLTLRSGAERLHLTCALDSSGQVTHTKTQLEAEGVKTDVVLGGAWDEALASYQPVFAYAALERRVQLSRDLQNYLEDLLALGGCFEAMEQEVTSIGADASKAFDAWTTAHTKAKADLPAVDSTYRRADRPDLPNIAWPELSDDIDKWAQANGLTEHLPTCVEITAAHGTRLQEAARELDQSVSDLLAATTTVHEQLADALDALDRGAAALDEPGPDCPVCSSANVDWVKTLHENVAQLAQLDQQRRRVSSAIGGLRVTSRDDLGPVLSILEDDEQVRAAARQGAQLASTFALACDQSGAASSSGPAVDAAVKLAEWVRTGGAAELVRRAAARSDHLRQWRAARADATAHFVSVWRESQTLATQAAKWEAVRLRVSDLRKRLRTSRTATLRTLTSQRVQNLLEDVGLRMGSLEVQATKASLLLLDPAGRQLELGMLSAGQRNAVLLAPLLATTDGGPFGFLVLDDPVHAFDELRVDRLSRVICELSKTRRVIVLSHDERLREHLMALPGHCDARSVERDPSSGEVIVRRGEEIWRALLTDARTLLQMAAPVPKTQLTITQTVRALCRQAVDNAIRDLLVRNALLRDRDVHADLAELDASPVRLTSARLDVAERLCPGQPGAKNTVAAARALCTPYLSLWNQGSHGNADRTPACEVEIDAALAACVAIVGSA